ncbi:MAG: hypothetical protein M5U28_38940 [Sandaracinaceae bacterium]|nr:hypothetical protein [Sandaracinaceae bacterium]
MKDLLDHPSLEASLDDLGDVYRVLTAHADEHPELAENGFVDSLQRLLEAQARVEGVDVADDAQWDAWLRGEDVAGEPSRDALN